MAMESTTSMNLAADNIRILAASMVEKAKSGHPGGAMGGADFINVLFAKFLVYDPEDPEWERTFRKQPEIFRKWEACGGSSPF